MDDDGASGDHGPSGSRRPYGRYLLASVGLAVLVAAFVVVLPGFVDYGDVWEQLDHMSTGWIAVLAAATIVNAGTYGLNWLVAMPGLRYRQSLEMSLASTTMTNLMPLGTAVGMGTTARMLRGWGHPTDSVARAVVITGLWKQLISVAFPVLSIVAVYLVEGKRDPRLESAATVGVVILLVVSAGLVLMFHSDEMARRLGAVWDRAATGALKVVRRGPVDGTGDTLSRFRVGSVDLLRRRWFALTVAEAIGALTVFATLALCLPASGVPRSDVGLAEAFAAWSFVRLLTSIPLTPGGLGFVEVGLTALLTQFGGRDASVVAAVLLYRVLTFVAPIAFGAFAAAGWWIRRRGRSSETARSGRSDTDHWNRPSS